MQRTRNTNIDKTSILACVVGGGIACAADIILSLLVALCLDREYFDINHMALLALVAQFLATLLGMLIAGRSKKENAVLIYAITGVFALVLRLCIAMLFFDGVTMQTMLGTIVATSVPFLAAYLLLKNKRAGGNRRKKRRYR